MSSYDSAAIKGGIPSLELMERAGQKMAESILNRYVNFSGNAGINIVVLCGPGNNGGDGLVVSRMLKDRALNLSVVRSESANYSQDNAAVADKLIKSGGKIIPSNSVILQSLISNADIIVDALLGTGQKEAPRGEIQKLVQLVNEYKGTGSKVIALDIPTGVDAGSGNVFKDHIKANFTITVEFQKRGMLQYPAIYACGEVDIVHIGISAVSQPEYSLLLSANIPKIKRRSADSHKGNFGHVLVIGGSSKYPGAPVLSSHAALRSGAGLVTYAALRSCILKSSYPELMYRTLKDSSGCFNAAHYDQLRKELPGFSSVVLGPGLGQAKQTKQFFNKTLELICKSGIPAVIDADGLNYLSEIINKKNSKRKLIFDNCVLTPHPAEMARLLNVQTSKVQADRFSAASQLAKKLGAVVVLKGAGTIVYSGKSGFVNITGNPYMAGGGSGDVLSGMIGAFIAQGHDVLSAAKLAVYLHGISGDIAFEKMNAPLLASDIIGQIPAALSRHS